MLRADDSYGTDGQGGRSAQFIMPFAAVAIFFALTRLVPARLRGSATASALLFSLRWLVISSLIGGLAGTASAGFLVSLDWVTSWREGHPAT